MYLPLKFHLKGRLEISDKLESGFYLIDGFWNKQFPFLTTLLSEPITTNYTAYTVDYSYGAQLSSNASPTESKTYTVTKNALERNDSSSNLIVDKCLPILILSAFKTM